MSKQSILAWQRIPTKIKIKVQKTVVLLSVYTYYVSNSLYSESVREFDPENEVLLQKWILFCIWERTTYQSKMSYVCVVHLRVHRQYQKQLSLLMGYNVSEPIISQLDNGNSWIAIFSKHKSVRILSSIIIKAKSCKLFSYNMGIKLHTTRFYNFSEEYTSNNSAILFPNFSRYFLWSIQFQYENVTIFHILILKNQFSSPKHML